MSGDIQEIYIYIYRRGEEHARGRLRGPNSRGRLLDFEVLSESQTVCTTANSLWNSYRIGDLTVDDPSTHSLSLLLRHTLPFHPVPLTNQFGHNAVNTARSCLRRGNLHSTSALELLETLETLDSIREESKCEKNLEMT